MKKIIGLVVTAFLAGCGGAGLNSEGASSAPQAAPKARDMSFYQEWVHSHEEQNGQKTPNIFRPKGSREFPPSRFRMQFVFDPNGKCTYMFLSPTDAHELKNCVYTKVDNAVYFYSEEGASLNHLAFTIQSVNSGEMRMAYGVAAPTPVLTNEQKKNIK